MKPGAGRNWEREECDEKESGNVDSSDRVGSAELDGLRQLVDAVSDGKRSLSSRCGELRGDRRKTEAGAGPERELPDGKSDDGIRKEQR